MNSSKPIKKGQIEDYISDSTQAAIDAIVTASGATNLTYTASPTQGTVNSDTGTNAVIPLANNTNAGLLSPAEKAEITTALQPGDVVNYTNEEAQDAVGTILVDTTTIDLSYNDATPSISADVKANSIDATHLSNTINVSEFINDSDYATEAYVDSKIPADYSKVVYVNNVNPNSATIFDLENPPLVNDDLLKLDVNNLYIGTDVSTWVYNGTIYVTKTVTSTTSNFFLSGTTTDAGNTKTANIKRTGRVGGANAIDSNDFVTKQQLDTKEPLITAGTTSQYRRGDKTWQTLDKTAVGLSNVDNTSDLNKPISTATQTALNLKENKSEKNTANGYAGLDSNSKIFSNQLPAIAITDTFVVASQSAMLALTTAEVGDIAVRTDINKTFILKGSSYSTLADWQELLTPTSAVTSVFGRAGAVVANSGDYTTSLVPEVTNLYYTEARVNANTNVAANTAARHNAVTLGTTNGLSLATQALSLGLSSTSTVGALSSTDWNTFNSKVSNATHTGDATGATALTLATVNSNIGSFGNASNVPQYTVNAKGLTTASANVPIQIAESQVTNLVTDLSNKQATLISGTNIRTINGNTLLGSTDLTIPVATDATTLAKGIIQLAGDLGGTADLPTVPSLALKANLASPALTGTPTAPTATAGTNTTQIATTAFVLANSQPSIPQLESNATDLTVWNNGKGNSSNNTSFGEFALRLNNGGVGNTAMGTNSLSANITGSSITAIGSDALSNINGSNNVTAIGGGAGRFFATNSPLTSAVSSIFIGGNSRAQADSQINQIVIGVGAVGAGSNSVTLGDTSITSTILRGAVSTNGTVTATSHVTTGGTTAQFVDGTGALQNKSIFQNAITGLTTNYLPKWNGSGFGDSQVFDNGTNVGVGSSNPLNKLTVVANDVFFQDSSGQLVITGATDINKSLSIGFDTTSNYAYMQSMLKGTSARPLILQPFGGNVISGTTTDNGVDKLQVNGTILGTQYKISALNTAPASTTALGTLGEIRVTATHIYVCTATNTWVRTALATW
jgi:hypothetical protein